MWQHHITLQQTVMLTNNTNKSKRVDWIMIIYKMILIFILLQCTNPLRRTEVRLKLYTDKGTTNYSTTLIGD
jgi:hypothetical protein